MCNMAAPTKRRSRRRSAVMQADIQPGTELADLLVAMRAKEAYWCPLTPGKGAPKVHDDADGFLPDEAFDLTQEKESWDTDAEPRRERRQACVSPSRGETRRIELLAMLPESSVRAVEARLEADEQRRTRADLERLADQRDRAYLSHVRAQNAR
eukprot:TRINITY_DN254_c0_g10_i1.p1 TRINITY_DN254_c0_g10~~TRINITY_DN254_c0_g10_i1.p1  ORF type:complete len:154 (+),score=14.53 TRINITY_DN254_c0_g10_i1:52-513(+)